MNINRKVELAKQAIASISQHDDADSAIRSAALDELDKFVIAEREAMAERIQSAITATLAPKDAS